MRYVFFVIVTNQRANGGSESKLTVFNMFKPIKSRGEGQALFKCFVGQIGMHGWRKGQTDRRKCFKN